MKKFIAVTFLVNCFIYLLNGEGSAVYIQDTDEYEGWVWRKSLNFSFPNNSNAFVDADAIHQEMAEIGEKLQASRSKEEKGGEVKKEGKNIALLRLGFIIEDKEGRQAYTSVPCFDDYAFYSGQETSKVSTTEEDLFQKIKQTKTPYLKQFIIDEPKAYSFSLQDIIAVQKKFFPKSNEGQSLVSVPKYKGQYLEDKLKESLQEKDPEESLKNVNGIISKFEGAHSDSEKKICFYLEDSLRDLPFYWNAKFLSFLRDILPAVEEFYIKTFNNEVEIKSKTLNEDITQRIMSLPSLPLDDSFTSKVKSIYSLKGDLKKVLSQSQPQATKKLPTVVKKNEKKKEIKKGEETKEEQLTMELQEEELKPISIEENVKNLLFLINNIEAARVDDPLKIGKEALVKDGSEQHFFHIKSLLSLKPKDSWKTHLDYIRNIILAREEEQSLWVRSLRRFLEKMPDDRMAIKGIIFHLYSRRDVCDFCTVRLSRECEYNAGFVAKLRSMVFMPKVKSSLPFFRILASCSEVRYPERSKHADQFSDQEEYLLPVIPNSGKTEEEKKVVFFQKLIKQ